MIIHVVIAGETLWQIANRYAVNMNSIVRVNGLPNPNQLIIGQSLVIPVSGTTHIIKYGETLWSIAQQYGVTIQSIIQANNLTNPNALYPGGKLIIPPIIHIVQPGETLGQIANRYGTTIQAIIIENTIENPNLIYAGMRLVIPRPKPTIEVNAYSYQSNEDAINSLNEVGPLLTYFSPFAYMIKEDGTLQMMNDQAMVDAAISKNIVPMMSITNFSSTEAGSNLSHVILSSADLREKLITNVLQVMDAKGYKVLNIDFENVLPEDRENYNTFLQLAVDRLHPKGYLVSTALAPKTSATQGGLLYEAHDYEAHGRIADFVVLMTYEWGYRLGPPQAISPINQMRRVVEYALSVMPAEKIFLGFQIYARDWLLPHVQGQEAETFSPQEAIRRAIKYGTVIQYDTTAQSPFFRYVDEQGRRHEVWFEDARSAQAKFDLAKQHNLRGISYWALGYPYPQNWTLLYDNFTIKKGLS
ncbi:LysM peptidoglycan-binding domain-containing protein [Psychrobacillus sp. FJAT-21963]|uniref:LysM peptidoglycan-binding domain-containing protein n=1 Tax=Psychrobacillus sp. FJAT-21963 TaxID=1712028 RepID=UPI0006FB63A5|nr:LysM peptidoglycan-binding domain-containing protein [Psychrobacillus sp. FJAT-21963]KQL34696.1 spore gernimation protein [Psychrobacillus sp. FJAT-21963]